MNVMSRVLVVVIVATSVQTSSAGPKDKDQTSQRFWEAPKCDVAWQKLSAAKVKLVSVPQDGIPYATIQMGQSRAPIDYVPSSPTVTPYVNREGSGYEVVKKGLEVGASPFTDRAFKIEQLPKDLSGLTLLQTRMGHKGIVDSRYAVVLSSEKPCYVFVAVDERAINTYKTNGSPAWLKEFAPTGLRIVTDDPLMKQTAAGFAVYAKQVSDDKIVLGPACCDPLWNAMYFAFFGSEK